MEQAIENAKVYKDLGTSLEKLRSNREFKKVILDGYFKDEAIRLVHLKSDPSMQTPEKQDAIIRSIDAIGSLVSYFRVVEQFASIAAKDIELNEVTIQEAREEGLE